MDKVRKRSESFCEVKTTQCIRQHNRVLALNRLVAMKQAAVKATQRTKEAVVPPKTIRTLQRKAVTQFATRIQRHVRGWLCRLKLDSALIEQSKQKLGSNIFDMHEAILGSTGKLDKIRDAALVISRWFKRMKFLETIRRLEHTYAVIKQQRSAEAERLLQLWARQLFASLTVAMLKAEQQRIEALTRIRANLAVASIRKYWRKTRLTGRKLISKIRRFKQRLRKAAMGRKNQRTSAKPRNQSSESLESSNTNSANLLPEAKAGVSEVLEVSEPVVEQREETEPPVLPEPAEAPPNVLVVESSVQVDPPPAEPVPQQLTVQPLDTKSIQQFEAPDYSERSIPLFANENKESYMAPTDASLNRFTFARRTLYTKTSLTPRNSVPEINQASGLPLALKVQPHASHYNYLKPTQSTLSRTTDHTKPEQHRQSAPKSIWVKPIVHTESSSMKLNSKKTEFEPCWRYSVQPVSQYVPSLDSKRESPRYPRTRLFRRATAQTQLTDAIRSHTILVRPISNRRRASVDHVTQDPYMNSFNI